MIKSRFAYLLLSFILVIAILTGCSSEKNNILNVDDEGNTNINQAALEEIINSEVIQPLKDIESEGIIFMREEEKLARDVYSRFYGKWGTNTFNNIGLSEQTHMDAMKSLIDRYGLNDPAQSNEMGRFGNQKLQQLYDELIEQGNTSEIDALKVGAAIEEIDILDLEEYISQTDKSDILTVYESLVKGSRNHLRSFVSVMKKQGITYEPQYLADKQYNEIITTSIENRN